MSKLSTVNHGLRPINLTHLKQTPIEMRPTELHMKEDGSILDEPSFCFVMQHPSMLHKPVSAQVSLDMLDRAMNELGYKIVKL